MTVCATCSNEVTNTIGVLLYGALPRVVGYCDTCLAPEATPEQQFGFCAPSLVPVWIRLIAEGKLKEDLAKACRKENHDIPCITLDLHRQLLGLAPRRGQ